MTGEDLCRKYHELCGWRPKPYANPGFAGATSWLKPGGGERWDSLPFLHLDANLAIAEADRVFTSGWRLFRGVRFSIQTGTNAFDVWTADTACEAILAALIAAKEAK